jgi:hypothetical protein
MMRLIMTQDEQTAVNPALIPSFTLQPVVPDGGDYDKPEKIRVVGATWPGAREIVLAVYAWEDRGLVAELFEELVGFCASTVNDRDIWASGMWDLDWLRRRAEARER